MVIASWESGCGGALAGALVAAIMVIESAPAAVSDGRDARVHLRPHEEVDLLAFVEQRLRG